MHCFISVFSATCANCANCAIVFKPRSFLCPRVSGANINGKPETLITEIHRRNSRLHTPLRDLEATPQTRYINLEESILCLRTRPLTGGKNRRHDSCSSAATAESYVKCRSPAQLNKPFSYTLIKYSTTRTVDDTFK